MTDFGWTRKSGWQLQVYQRGPLRRTVLNMVNICLSVCALCLVSLAGWHVQDRRHLKTVVETTQVSSLPELLSRSSLAVSVSAFDTPSYVMR
jgi:hypothetical protein